MKPNDRMRTTFRNLASGCFILLIASLPWAIAPMTLSAILCGLLTLFLVGRKEAPGGVLSPVEPAALMWFVALLAASVFALDPSGSFPRLNKGLLPALVPLAAFHTPTRRQGARVVAILMISATLAASHGLVDFVIRGASFATRARGPTGHYMTFAGQLLLIIGLAAALVVVGRGRWRSLGAVFLGLGGTALVGTFTRSAWIGVGVALTVILARARPRWVPVLIAALLAVYVLAPGEHRERLHSAFDVHHPMNVERGYMWEAGLRIARDHPWTGVGLQDMATTYDRYRSPNSRERVGHLHNSIIQIAASMGGVGLVAFAFLVVAMFRAAGRGLGSRLRAGGLGPAVQLGTVAALAGFMAAGLFEWNFGDEELLYMLYTMVGIAWSARRWEEPQHPSPAPAPAGNRA